MAKRKNQELTAELIAKAKAEDPKARNQLADWMTTFLRAKIKVSLHRTHDRRSDIAQDIAEELMKGLDTFVDTLPTDFEKWISKKAFQRAADSIRDAEALKRDINKNVSIDEHFVEGDVPADQKSPSQMCADTEIGRIAMGILWDNEKLPAQQRKIIVLRIMQQVSVAEIAGRMGRTEAQVDSSFRRGMEKLRKLYGAELGETSRKTTPVARDKRAAAFLEYQRRCEKGKPVDIGVFLAEVESNDDELRAMLELIEELRKVAFGDDDDADEES